MDEHLDLTALKKAVTAFENAFAYACRVESKMPEDREHFEFETARASLIQHFEITYELCWKTMKRYIEMDIGGDADILTRKNLFRQAAEKQLIADFERWVSFHDARNRTSHMYSENVAHEVYAYAKLFAEDMRQFVRTMEERV